MYLGACVLLVGVLGWCALLVRAGWKWLPARLEPRVPGWCVLGSCPGWKWLPACLGVCALLGGSLVGSSLVVGSCAWLVWLPACLETRALLVCPWLEVITCTP